MVKTKYVPRTGYVISKKNARVFSDEDGTGSRRPNVRPVDETGPDTGQPGGDGLPSGGNGGSRRGSRAV